MNKTAIISGIGGMDGFYLSHLLLKKEYRVIGILRRSANDNDIRLRTLRGSPNFNLVYGDVTDATSINKIVREFQPDEFYHLAANSFVGCSWDSPVHVLETNTIGTVNCLEALRQFKKDCRFYFAGSSEQFGNSYSKKKPKFTKKNMSLDMQPAMLDEESPMIAASPYGVSKVAGYQMTRVYRESYDMFASCGILFNHSAPLRGEQFFTRKTTSELAKIHWGIQDKVGFGNLSAKRDEGYSGDYVEAMHLMLQHNEPDDFVIATGETHSCMEWLEKALDYFELTKACVSHQCDSLMRPNEVNILIGDSSKAQQLLGWKPKCDFDQLVDKMCRYDHHLQSPDPSYSRKADEFLF
jgi:GDPmannose 4,6-dehydratase